MNNPAARNVPEPHPGNTGRRSARLRSLAGYRQLASATPSMSSTPPGSPAWPPDDATIRWLCSVGWWSVHGCKSVGRDTVGAGIEFAASCQGGDFLTDSLGGQCGIEAL